MYIKEQTAKVRQYQHEKDPEKALELLDYAEKRANTVYGVLGVKVWLFKSEIL